MDGDRQREIAKLIKWSALGWGAVHVMLSALALYAFYKPDPQGLRIALYMLIGLGPFFAVALYLEARAIWLGNPDKELGAALAGLAIMGGLVALAWVLG